MQTTFEFMLPRGYVDENGEVHRNGTMRLATAADEILPLRDPRVQQNGGYLSIILLSRVITKLGTLPAISTKVIENLFTVEIAYLQDLYQRINLADTPVYKAVCPKCGEEMCIRDRMCPFVPAKNSHRSAFCPNLARFPASTRSEHRLSHTAWSKFRTARP